MPFASINSTNPRTNPWNFHEKILRIGGAGKWGFFEAAILNLFFQKKKNASSNEKSDSWSSRINFIPFRFFRGPLFHKPVIGQELFLLFLSANRLQPFLIIFSCRSQPVRIFKKIKKLLLIFLWGLFLLFFHQFQPIDYLTNIKWLCSSFLGTYRFFKNLKNTFRNSVTFSLK